jgi:hypothetical protein
MGDRGSQWHQDDRRRPLLIDNQLGRCIAIRASVKLAAMAVGPIQPGQVPQLRLVQSDQPVQPVQPVQRTSVASPVRRTESDSYDFQAVLRQAQPVTSLEEARRKLEAIREQLVAAKTSVPIHFDPPPAKPVVNNAALQAYMKIQSAVTPTDRNTAATEAELR